MFAGPASGDATKKKCGVERERMRAGGQRDQCDVHVYVHVGDAVNYEAEPNPFPLEGDDGDDKTPNMTKKQIGQTHMTPRLRWLLFVGSGLSILFGISSLAVGHTASGVFLAALGSLTLVSVLRRRSEERGGPKTRKSFRELKALGFSRRLCSGWHRTVFARAIRRREATGLPGFARSNPSGNGDTPFGQSAPSTAVSEPVWRTALATMLDSRLGAA